MLVDVILFLLAISVFAIGAVALIVATAAIVPLYTFFLLGLGVAVLFALLRRGLVSAGRRG